MENCNNRITSIPDEVIYNNLDYYKNVQSKHEKGGLFASWNWPAFFFGPIWLLYRRCYLGALAVYFFQYFVTLILSTPTYFTETISETFLISMVASLIPCIVIGIYGNSSYFYFMKNKIEKLLREGAPISVICEKCRPSWMPVWIYFGISFGITILCAIGLFAIFMIFGFFLSQGFTV